MRRFLSCLLALPLIGCSREAASGPTSPFRPGQVWTYQTRPGEEASRIIICRVETEPKLGQIVHIHINGLRIKNKHAPEGITPTVGHMPYTSDALQACVVKLESLGTTLPDFEDGYREWKKASGGAWTLPLAEAIAGMEETLNK